MQSILIIGATGFVGGYLARDLRQAGYPVRCLVRSLSRAQQLVHLGCDLVEGDIADSAIVQSAVAGVQAVYISVHTLSPQPSSEPSMRFMDIERRGLENVLAACRATGARLVYMTSLGTAAASPHEWLRERWHAEQRLLASEVATTVLRPGLIVGRGGMGFENLVRQARMPRPDRQVGERPLMCPIAVADLVYYLRGILTEPRTAEQGFDVGSDEVLSPRELTEIIAAVLAELPAGAAQLPAPVSGNPTQAGKLPPGAAEVFTSGTPVDLVGDNRPIRLLLPQPLLGFREAVTRALTDALPR